MAFATQGLEGDLGLENTKNDEGLKWDWWDGDGGEGLVDGGTAQAADNDEGSMVLADSSATSLSPSSWGFDQPLFEDNGMYTPSPPSFDEGWDAAVG